MGTLTKFFNAVYTGTFWKGLNYDSKSDAERKEIAEQMYSKYKTKLPKVNEVGAEELQQWLKSSTQKVLLVDTRKTEEVEISRIPGAITESEFEDLSESNPEGLDEYEKVVFYCTIGYRSALSVDKHARNMPAAKDKFFNLKGSILLWLHNGGEVVTGENETTKQVHCYGKAWNLAPKSYASVTF